MTKSIAVLGAGNGGIAAAAHLTLDGHAVTLYSRNEKTLAEIEGAGGIQLEGAAGEGLARLKRLTGEIEEAVADADLVMLVVPSTAIGDYATNLAPHLKDGQPVFLNPGGTGGALELVAGLRRGGFTGVTKVCEVSTLTYACRRSGPAAVRVSNLVPSLPFAAFPGRYAEELHALVSSLYPAVNLQDNVLYTGFANVNPIEHPPQALLNTGWIEHTGGDFYFYYEGTTPSVGRVIDVVDQERLAIADAMGVVTPRFVDSFRDAGYTTAEAAATGSAYQALQHSEPNRWFKSPSTMDHRYVHEDIGYGLVPWAAWARLSQVATPVIDGLITIGSTISGKNYAEHGRTLARMGLAGVSQDDLQDFLYSGAAEVTGQ